MSACGSSLAGITLGAALGVPGGRCRCCTPRSQPLPLRATGFGRQEPSRASSVPGRRGESLSCPQRAFGAVFSKQPLGF